MFSFFLVILPVSLFCLVNLFLIMCCFEVFAKIDFLCSRWHHECSARQERLNKDMQEHKHMLLDVAISLLFSLREL